MKFPVLLFIFAQIVDCITTYFGINMGFGEANILLNKFGWPVALGFKAVTVYAIAYFLQKYKWKPRSIWIIVGATWLIPIWNIGVILLG